MSSEIKLLACPFCGIDAKNPLIECFDEETGIGGEFVYSPNCLNKNCILGSGYHCAFDDEQEAIAAWNTRADLCAKDVGVCKDCTDFGCNTCLPETPTPTEAIRNESAETFHTQDHAKRAGAFAALADISHWLRNNDHTHCWSKQIDTIFQRIVAPQCHEIASPKDDVASWNG